MRARTEPQHLGGATETVLISQWSVHACAQGRSQMHPCPFMHAHARTELTSAGFDRNVSFPQLLKLRCDPCTREMGHAISEPPVQAPWGVSRTAVTLRPGRLRMRVTHPSSDSQFAVVSGRRGNSGTKTKTAETPAVYDEQGPKHTLDPNPVLLNMQQCIFLGQM